MSFLSEALKKISVSCNKNPSVQHDAAMVAAPGAGLPGSLATCRICVQLNVILGRRLWALTVWTAGGVPGALLQVVALLHAKKMLNNR
jgi:hypothetical protein